MELTAEDIKSAPKMVEVLNQMLSTLEQLKQGQANQNQKPSSDQAKPAGSTTQAVPAHGMCDNQECEACAAQGEEIVGKAYAQGAHDTLAQLDQWLILAAGEDARQKIMELAARGKLLYERDQQSVKIVA